MTDTVTTGTATTGTATPLDPRTAYPRPPYGGGTGSLPGRTEDMDPAPDHGEESWVGRGRLTDRVVVVTGGDSGIGRAMAVATAKEGADVLLTHLEQERPEAETVLEAVRGTGRRGEAMAVDLTREEDCRRVVERAVETFGRVDVLVNNAGTQESVERVEDITAEMLETVYRLNLFAMFHLTRHALPHMRPGSSIVNVTSIQSSDPSPQLLHYATTKAAIRAFTVGLAQELAERGIRVNAVAPGATWTPLIPATMPAEKVESFGGDSPIGRAAQPVEMAGAFVFLASDEATYVTGETIAVTGGRPL
ncbi:MAG: glucose 1-dehydrogenase [Kineosporiaceae bacterium]